MNSCNPNDKIKEFFKRIGVAIIPGLLMGFLFQQIFLIFTGDNFMLPALGKMIFHSLSFILGFATFYYLSFYLYFSSFIGLILLLGIFLHEDSSFYFITYSLGSLWAYFMPKIKNKTLLFLFVISCIIGTFLATSCELFSYYQFAYLLIVVTLLFFIKLKREKKLIYFFLIIFLLIGISFIHVNSFNRERISFVEPTSSIPVSIMGNTENNFDALIVTNLGFSLVSRELDSFPYIKKVDLINLGDRIEMPYKDKAEKIFEYHNFYNAKLQKQYDLIILETFIQNKVITYNYINALWNKLSYNGAFIIPSNCVKLMPKDAKFSYIPGIDRRYVAAGKIKLSSDVNLLDKRFVKLLSSSSLKDFFYPGIFSALYYDEYKDVLKSKLEDVKRVYDIEKLNIRPWYLLIILGCYLIFRLFYIKKAKDSNFILAMENYATLWLLLFTIWKNAFDKNFGDSLELAVISSLGLLSIVNLQLRDKAYTLLQILSLSSCLIFFFSNTYLTIGLLLLATLATSGATSRLYDQQVELKMDRFLPVVTGVLLSSIIAYIIANTTGNQAYYIAGVYLLYRFIFIFTKSYSK